MIEVKGNRLIEKETVLSQLPVSEGISFFSINVSQLQKSLLSLPEVKEVEVARIFPNKIYITILEKRIIGLVRSNNYLYPVFEDGVVMKKNYFNLEMHDKPIIEGWKLPNRTVQLACSSLSYLPKKIFSQIVRIKPVANEPDQVEIVTKRNHHVFIRSVDLSEKLKFYLSFLDRPPGKLYLLESVWFKPEKYSS